jgi:hypothetical protein
MSRWAALLILWGFAPGAWAGEPVTVVPPDAFPDARQPQAAVAPGGRVYVTFGVEDEVYCTSSADGGRSFPRPVKVGEAGVMALGMRRGPRVAATAQAVVIAAVCGKAGKGRDGDVVAWRSTDEGRTWQGPVRVNAVVSSAREGLHGLAAGPGNRFACVWLDLRADKSQVYLTVSEDGGATWQPDRLVYASPDGNVCQCCQPSVVFDPQGGLHVLWRNLLGGARDMFVTSSTDGGRTFGPARKLGRGTWDLNQCPMDGGGLAADAQGRLTAIWMRKKELFRTTAAEPEARLGPGEQGWAAPGPGGVYLVWITARPGRVMALSPGQQRPVRLAERGADPVVAGPLQGNGPVFAVWEEGKPGAMTIRGALLNP